MPGGAPQILGGPVWWYVFGMYVLTLVLSAYVLIDSLSAPRKAALERLPEPGWLYTAIGGVFLALALLVWIPRLVRPVPWLAAVPVLLAPVSLIAGVAYLLRVVFPRPADDAAADTEDDSPSVV